MTMRSKAIYHAKQAFALMKMTGRINSNLARCDVYDCWRYVYDCGLSGAYIVYIRHASDYRNFDGAVDAKLTRLANL